MLPNGRLTLSTGLPYMNAAVAGGTTYYYTPAIGDQVYYWTGTAWTSESFTELSALISESTYSPAATIASRTYDVFVWKDGGGVYRVSRGPVWPTKTVRGTGAGSSELVMQKGFFVNKYDITNGPAAGYGLQVGVLTTNASNVLIYTPTADAGTEPNSLQNTYNRRLMQSAAYDGWNFV